MSTPTRWFDVALLTIAGIVAAFHIGKVPPSLPLLRSELELSLTTAGWVLSTINLIGMAFGMAAGLLADRVGARRTLLAGLALLVVADIAGSLARSVPEILAGRFVEGIGFFAIVVAAPPLMLRAATIADARLVMGLWSAYMPAGTAIMMLLAPFVLEPVGWRGLWLFSGCLTLLCLSALLWRGGGGFARQSHDVQPLWRSIRATLSRPGPVILAAAFGSYTFCFLAIMGFMPTYMIEQRGVSIATAGLLTAVAVGANIIGNLSSGPLQSRGVARSALIAVAAGAMALCAIVIFSESIADGWRYAACLTFSAIGGLAPGALFASVPHNAPQQSLIGTTGGLMMQGSNLGSSLGPPALALLVTASGGWGSGAWLLCTALALCIAAAFLLGRSERHAYTAR